MKVLHDGVWEDESKFEIKFKKFVDSPIAQVPANGYVNGDNYSQISIQYLYWIEHKSRLQGKAIEIIHALNKGEHKIVKYNDSGPNTVYRVDGFVKPDVNSASKGKCYDFHGCFTHACPTCYPERKMKHPRTGQSMSEIYALTLKKEKYL